MIHLVPPEPRASGAGYAHRLVPILHASSRACGRNRVDFAGDAQRNNDDLIGPRSANDAWSESARRGDSAEEERFAKAVYRELVRNAEGLVATGKRVRSRARTSPRICSIFARSHSKVAARPSELIPSKKCISKARRSRLGQLRAIFRIPLTTLRSKRLTSGGSACGSAMVSATVVSSGSNHQVREVCCGASGSAV